MLRTFIIAVLLLVTASCDRLQRSPASPPSTPSGAGNSQSTSVRTGKYQLLQATVESGQGKRLQTVLRINTETGETWILLPEDPAKWQRINDPDLSNSEIDPLKLFSPEENAKRRNEREKSQR